MSRELKVLFSVIALIIVGAIGALYYRYTIINEDDATSVKTAIPVTTNPIVSPQKETVEETKAIVVEKPKTQAQAAEEEDADDVSDSGLTAEEEETEMDKEEGDSFGVIDMKSSAEAEDE